MSFTLFGKTGLKNLQFLLNSAFNKIWKKCSLIENLKGWDLLFKNIDFRDVGKGKPKAGSDAVFIQSLCLSFSFKIWWVRSCLAKREFVNFFYIAQGSLETWIWRGVVKARRAYHRFKLIEALFLSWFRLGKFCGQFRLVCEVVRQARQKVSSIHQKWHINTNWWRKLFFKSED